MFVKMCTSISVDVSRTKRRLPSHDAKRLPSGAHAHGPPSSAGLLNSMPVGIWREREKKPLTSSVNLFT